MGKNSKSRKILTRSESGTCNVCSAPCSSCLHINRGSTTVKSEESSGETCQENIGSRYSVTDVHLKISACDSGQHAASETSTANLNRDVHFRDGTNKSGLRSVDVSRAFDDGEMPPTLSPGGTVERHCDKRADKNKYEERKGNEGRDDSTSCVTGGSDSNKLASSDNKSLGLRHGLEELFPPKNELNENSCSDDKNEGGSDSNKLASSDNKSLGLRHGLEELFPPKNELNENSCSDDKNEGVRPSKRPSTMSDFSSQKSLSCCPDAKNLKEKLGSKEHFSLHSVKEEAFNVAPGQEAIDHRVQNESRSVALEEICLKLEDETTMGNSVASEKVGFKLISENLTDTVTENQPNKVVNSSMLISENEKMESWELSGVQENDMESQSMIDSDESDVLEHDVKVCDICGDAGHEDKLAICSRCSDGAEHTYCMREMIEKVPEGDWLCEECKSCDEIKSKAAVAVAAVSGKYQSSEGASAEDINLLNVDGKYLDGEASKTIKKLLGKRNIADRFSEDIETPSEAKRQALGPTVELSRSPRRVATLSRDSSLKNYNKGELKPPHQSYSARSPNNETGLRQQTARSTLSKSSSFCTNVKSKLDFFNEVPQKQKSAKESAYPNKEGASKLIGKSMSFRPLTSSRLNSSESKVKMSSKFSHSQDAKGLRQTKAHNVLERKSSFKPEGMVNTTISNSTDSAASADQSDPIGSNNSEMKGVLADSKPIILSKSLSHSARKGEMKISSVSEQRTKETSVKDDSVCGAHTTEKLSSKSKGGLPGILTRPREIESTGDKIRESSFSRSRISIDSPRDIVNDASATRSSADVIKGNKLKAAIEAAILKKPGICRKNKQGDQSDEVPMPSTNLNSETRTDDQVSTPSNRRNTSIANESHEEQATSSNGDQISLPIRVASLKTAVSFPIVSSGLSNQHSATVSVLLKMSVLPEHNFIWQGVFDIRKIGKIANLHDGLQAHLSTFASPKVLEVVNKFPAKLILNEVPRVSTWPVQFHEAGVKEDNIALYFFAKDLDSYERNYKSLLETMMRRDVALKGNFDGVELLIFPSNHLPQNSQRWNTLYFLWGVFRKRKASGQNVSDSNAFDASKASECPTTVDLPSVSRNINADKNSASLVFEGPFSENVNRVYDTKVSIGDSDGQSLQENVEKQDYGVDAKRISDLSLSETKDATAPLEEMVDPKTKIKPDAAKFQPSVQDAKTNLPNTRQSSSSSGTTSRANPSDDPETLEKTVKEEEESNYSSSSNLGKRLPYTCLPEGESANKKQKTDSSVIGSADNNTSPKMVPNLGHVIEGEKIASKRGIELDLNEAQDYTPDSPSPAAKQERVCLFDLNVAQDYPPDNDDEGDGSPLSLLFPVSKKDPEVIPASKIEPVLPSRPNTRSSRFFLDGLSK